MYTQPSALQIRWGNILAQVIIALSNHLLPVTDGVIALLEPDALTNLHAIVTILHLPQIINNVLIIAEPNCYVITGR